MMRINRRTLVLAGLVAGVVRPLAAEALPEIQVAKDATCPCCEAWVEHLRAEGFQVTVKVLADDALQALKTERGVPVEARSCHTAEADGFVLEGHVPAREIRRLLADRPEAIGLAVPGMPFGSPGMGPDSEREAYDVLLIGKGGTTSVFANYPAAA